MNLCIYVSISIYVYLYLSWLAGSLPSVARGRRRICLYTILPLSILYGMYCNTEWSGGNTILRNSVGDEGGGVRYPD